MQLFLHRRHCKKLWFLASLTILQSWASSVYAAYQVELEVKKSLKPILMEHLDLVRYQSREDLNDDQLHYLVATVKDQVKQFLSTEGYFSPETTVSIEEKQSQKIIHLHIDERERTHVSEVNLDLIGAAERENPPRIDRIKKNWRLPVGQAFRQEDWDTAKGKVVEVLQRKRYAAAKVNDSEARIHTKTHQAELNVQFDSGPVFTLGALHVTGLKRYPETIIQAMNPLVVGEEYDVDRLLELQRQIQKTPYFGSVQVSIDSQQTEHPKEVPVEVSVTEYALQQLRLGGGYASDTGAHIGGRYSHLNVLNRAMVFNGEAKLEQQHQLGAIELAMPPDPRGYINSVHSSVDRTTLAGVDLRSQKTGMQRSRTQENYSVTVGVDYYQDDLQQIDGAVLPPDTLVLPGKHQAFVPYFNWSRRNVDNPLFPRKGNTISVDFGFGLKQFFTDETFSRLHGRIRQYIPMENRDTVILHGEGGAISSKGGSVNIPASLLFRTGGTDSVRGYKYQGIGNATDGTVFPVKYMLAGGVEYQHWYTRDWGGALFYDAGVASNNWSAKTLYQGVGFGVRWRSPVGPINVDIAYGIQESRVRPHFSLGVAF
jgi:translocation and assembly module TamA